MQPIYGSLAGLTRQFGEDELLQLAGVPDHAGGYSVLNDQRIEYALIRASREADTYLAPRYRVPLAMDGDDAPEPLKSIVGDMARYHLSGGPAQASEDILRRYDDARAWLRGIAKGEMDLVLPNQGSDTPLTPTEPA